MWATVFIARKGYYDDDEVVGVFSSESMAIAALGKPGYDELYEFYVDPPKYGVPHISVLMSKEGKVYETKTIEKCYEPNTTRHWALSPIPYRTGDPDSLYMVVQTDNVAIAIRAVEKKRKEIVKAGLWSNLKGMEI